MRTTIKDIAQALGVSVATVSRALTNKHDVSEEMKSKVLEMAKKLRYKPNIYARNLLKNDHHVIGVVVPEFITFFFPEIIIGIQDVMNPLGYQVLICQSNESSTLERKNIEMLENQMVEGLIISVAKESRNFELYERLVSDNMPMVFINRVINDLEVSKVIIDDRKWAFKAVKHLIKCGYRRIAHLAGNEHLSITQGRLEGYLDALKAYDIPVDERLIMHVGVQQDRAKIGLNYLLSLKQKPDAIFAVNDPIAIGTLLELKERNIKVPEEIGVVGFSESPIGKILGLTSVAQPTFEIGRASARMLLNKIQQPSMLAETQILDGQLNIRGSSLRKKI